MNGDEAPTRNDKLLRPFALWVFCDESGDIGNRQDTHVIISVVTTSHVPSLRRIANETRLNVRPRLPRGHILHAATDPPKVTKDYLQRLAKVREIGLGIIALNKANIWRYIPPNDIYAMMMSYALARTLELSAVSPERILVIIERRYTLPHRLRLQSAIVERTGISPNQIYQEPKSSPVWRDPISAADAVAWAWRQQLEYGRRHFVRLLTHQVVWQEIVGIDHEAAMRPLSEMIGEQQKGQL